MKPAEFITEVKESQFYYDGFEREYAIFQRYQELVLNTLKEFCLVCEKYNIDYQLAYGSLLGAVRDGGQIPWDYDVDVFVPTEERKELVRALKSTLNQNYYFFSIENSQECSHVILRMAPKGYDTRFLHVDVFFMAGFPNDAKTAGIYKKEICELSLLYKAQKFNFMDRGTNSKREVINMLWYRLKGVLKQENHIWKGYQKLAIKYPINTAKLCCSADRFSSYYEFPTSMITDTVMLDTTNGSYRVPKDYPQILKIIYGDYASIPPLKNRIAEFRRHFDFLISNCSLKE